VPDDLDIRRQVRVPLVALQQDPVRSLHQHDGAGDGELVDEIIQTGLEGLPATRTRERIGQAQQHRDHVGTESESLQLDARRQGGTPRPARGRRDDRVEQPAVVPANTLGEQLGKTPVGPSIFDRVRDPVAAEHPVRRSTAQDQPADDPQTLGFLDLGHERVRGNVPRTGSVIGPGGLEFGNFSGLALQHRQPTSRTRSSRQPIGRSCHGACLGTGSALPA